MRQLTPETRKQDAFLMVWDLAKDYHRDLYQTITTVT